MRPRELTQAWCDEVAASAFEGLLTRTFGRDVQRALDVTITGLLSSHALIVAVPLKGSQAHGQVFLSVPQALSAQLMNAFLGQTGGSNPDVSQLSDFVGELCNMLAGRFGALLADAGVELELGTPSSVSPAAAQQLARWLIWTCATLPIGLCVQMEGLQ